MRLMKYPNRLEKTPISPPANGPNIIPPKIMGNLPKAIMVSSTPPIETRRLAIRIIISKTFYYLIF